MSQALTRDTQSARCVQPGSCSCDWSTRPCRFAFAPSDLAQSQETACLPTVPRKYTDCFVREVFLCKARSLTFVQILEMLRDSQTPARGFASLPRRGWVTPEGQWLALRSGYPPGRLPIRGPGQDLAGTCHLWGPRVTWTAVLPTVPPFLKKTLGRLSPKRVPCQPGPCQHVG